MNRLKGLLLSVIICFSALSFVSCQYVDVEGSDDKITDSNETIKEIVENSEVDSLSEDSKEVKDDDNSKDSKDTNDNKVNSADDGVVIQVPKTELEMIAEMLTVTDYNFEGDAVDVGNPSDVYVLANKKNALPSDYVPEDLVVPDIKFSFSGEHDKKNLRQVAADALTELFNEAESLDIHLFAVSGYRSYNTQNYLFTNYSSNYGEEAANKFSARPGQSEHQLGLAMDVSAASVNYGLETLFGETVEGIWVAENAHLFGFIIRYPEGKEDITGYQYEPWHLRYVGTGIARYIYENELTLEEFYEAVSGLE